MKGSKGQVHTVLMVGTKRCRRPLGVRVGKVEMRQRSYNECTAMIITSTIAKLKHRDTEQVLVKLS